MGVVNETFFIQIPNGNTAVFDTLLISLIYLCEYLPHCYHGVTVEV